MPSAQKFLKLFHAFLKKSPAFSSFPFSLLLIGLEELMEINLSCPCKYEQNIFLIASIFIGPPLFQFALMFLVLRPCKYKCSPKKSKDGQQNTPNANKNKDGQQNTPNPNENKNDQQITINTNENKDDQRITPNANENKDDQQNFRKALGHCLIPPVMWIIILFLDGDYLACVMTKWEGNYVFDKGLNRSWCQPIKEANAGNQDDLRRIYQGYISRSKAVGYVLLAIFGVLIVVTVGIYDWCTSENSGRSCCKIFTSCKVQSTCSKGASTGTVKKKETVNTEESVKLRNVGKTPDDDTIEEFD